jgi:hypothetical protein
MNPAPGLIDGARLLRFDPSCAAGFENRRSLRSLWITTTGWHEVGITSTSLGVIVAQVTTKALLKTV